MAMSDEARSNPRYKPKKKKSFAETFIPQKGDSSKELLSKATVFIALIALVVCGIILAVHFYELFEANHNNRHIAEKYKQIGNRTGSLTVSTEVGENGEIIRNPLTLMPFAEEMLEINPDYAGYVSIPNCINEAVMQTADNDYYLDYNIYGQKRSTGTVFADYRNVVNDYADLQSDNIILYGHNNKNGSMFGNMDYYLWDYKYWLKNPFIYFDNKYEHSTYVIIASFVTNSKPEHDNGNIFDYYNYVNFTPKYSFDAYIKEINERSHFHTGIDVNENDKFITLSTCSYEWDEARHVIIGRKLRTDETTLNLDLSEFEVNTNPKWPAVYYKYNGGAYVE